LGKLRQFGLLVSIILSSAVTGSLNAQSNPLFPDNWVFRLSMGKTQFYGDASHDDKWEKLMTESRLDYTANVRKQYGKVIGLGAELFYSKVRSRKGEDNMPTPLKYELAAYYGEFNAFVFFDLSALMFRNGFAHRFAVYSTAGLGYSLWNSELRDVTTGDIRYSGNTYDGHYYGTGSPVMPFTFGIEYKITHEWVIFVDTQMRMILNDQLDVWADGSPVDYLFAASLGISYRINYPTWSMVKKGKRRSKENNRLLDKIYYDHHP
jgi:hypothetical protein